jgi:hypothetical protein
MSDSIRAEFGSKFMTAADFKLGERRTGVIDFVAWEMVGFPRERKRVIHWIDQDLKPYILSNKVNALKLADCFGDDPSTWSGRTTAIYTIETSFGDEPKQGVRFEPIAVPPPKAGDGQADKNLDDEVPF